MAGKLKTTGFASWLEARQERLGEYLDVVLGALGLDEEGASTPLSSLDRDSMSGKIRALDKYSSLGSRRRSEVDAAMEAEDGTVLDVVKAMAGYGSAT